MNLQHCLKFLLLVVLFAPWSEVYGQGEEIELLEMSPECENLKTEEDNEGQRIQFREKDTNGTEIESEDIIEIELQPLGSSNTGINVEEDLSTSVEEDLAEEVFELTAESLIEGASMASAAVSEISGPVMILYMVWDFIEGVVPGAHRFKDQVLHTFEHPSSPKSTGGKIRLFYKALGETPLYIFFKIDDFFAELTKKLSKHHNYVQYEAEHLVGIPYTYSHELSFLEDLNADKHVYTTMLAVHAHFDQDNLRDYLESIQLNLGPNASDHDIRENWGAIPYVFGEYTEFDVLDGPTEMENTDEGGHTYKYTQIGHNNYHQVFNISNVDIYPSDDAHKLSVRIDQRWSSTTSGHFRSWDSGLVGNENGQLSEIQYLKNVNYDFISATESDLRVYAFRFIEDENGSLIPDLENRYQIPYTFLDSEDENGEIDQYIINVDSEQIGFLREDGRGLNYLGYFAKHKVPQPHLASTFDVQSEEDVYEEDHVLYYAKIKDYQAYENSEIAPDVPVDELNVFPEIYSSNNTVNGSNIDFLSSTMTIDIPKDNKDIASILVSNARTHESVLLAVKNEDVIASSFRNENYRFVSHPLQKSSDKEGFITVTLEDVPFAAGDFLEVKTHYDDDYSWARSLLMYAEGGSFDDLMVYNFTSAGTHLMGSHSDGVLNANDSSSIPETTSVDWIAQRIPGDYPIFSFMNKGSGTVLGVDTVTNNVGLYDWDLMNNGLQWYGLPISHSETLIVNLHTNEYLIYYSETGSFGSIDISNVIKENDHGEYIDFELIEPGGRFGAKKIEAFDLHFVDVDKEYVIWNRAAREQTLDATPLNPSLEGVADVHFTTNVEENCDQWIFEYIGFAQYNIKSVCTGKYLTEGKEIPSSLSDEPQSWYLEQLPDGDVWISDFKTGEYVQAMIVSEDFKFSQHVEVDGKPDEDDIRHRFRFIPSDQAVDEFASYERGWYTFSYEGTEGHMLLMLDPIGNNEYFLMDQNENVLTAKTTDDVSFESFDASESQKWVLYHNFNGVVLYNRFQQSYYYLKNIVEDPILSKSYASTFNLNLEGPEFILDDREFVVLNEEETNDFWYAAPNADYGMWDLKVGSYEEANFENYKFSPKYAGARRYIINHNVRDEVFDLNFEVATQELLFEPAQPQYWILESAIENSTERFYIKCNDSGKYMTTAIGTAFKEPILTTEHKGRSSQWRFLEIPVDAESLDMYYRNNEVPGNATTGLKYTYQDQSGVSFSGISAEGFAIPIDKITSADFSITYEGFIQIPSQDYYEFMVETTGVQDVFEGYKLYIGDELIIDGSKVGVYEGLNIFYSLSDIPLSAGYHRLKLVYDAKGENGQKRIPEYIILKMENNDFAYKPVDVNGFLAPVNPSDESIEELVEGVTTWRYDFLDQYNHEFLIDKINNEQVTINQLFSRLGSSLDENMLYPDAVDHFVLKDLVNPVNSFSRDKWYHFKGFLPLTAGVKSLRLTCNEHLKLYLGGTEVLQKSAGKHDKILELDIKSEGLYEMDIYIESINSIEHFDFEFSTDNIKWDSIWDLIYTNSPILMDENNMVLKGTMQPELNPNEEYYHAYGQNLDIKAKVDGSYILKLNNEYGQFLYIDEYWHKQVMPWNAANLAGRWIIKEYQTGDYDPMVYTLKFEYPDGRQYYMAILPDGDFEFDENFVQVIGKTNHFNIQKADDLLVHYTFDDGGQDARDQSVYGNHGTYVGGSGAKWEDRGNVVSYDGLDGYVSTAVNIPETECGISFWFRTTDPYAGLFSAVVSGTAGGGHDRNIYLQNGLIKARLWQNEVIGSSAGTNFADGKWHHLAYTYGASISGQKLYVDDVLVASGTKNQSDFDWQAQISIGQSRDAQNDFLNGSIDEFKVYAHALTAADVNKEYMNGKLTAPIAYYPLDVDANDYSGNEQHGLNHYVYIDPNSGMINGAAEFHKDGVHGHINLPVSLSMSSRVGSVSMLAKTDHQHATNEHGIIFYGTDANTGDGFGSQNEYHIGTSEQGFKAFFEGTAQSGKDLYQGSGQPEYDLDGEWHHVVHTWNDEGVKLYVDGVLKKGAAHFVNSFEFSNLIRLGSPHIWSSRMYKGSLDEVKLYNEVLSEDEIKAQADMYGLTNIGISSRSLAVDQSSDEVGPDEDDLVASEDILVYPNPASNQFTIRVSEMLGNEVEFRLYDLVGKEMLSITDLKLGSDREAVIDVKSIAPGFYTMKIANTISGAVAESNIVLD